MASHGVFTKWIPWYVNRVCGVRVISMILEHRFVTGMLSSLAPKGILTDRGYPALLSFDVIRWEKVGFSPQGHEENGL